MTGPTILPPATGLQIYRLIAEQEGVRGILVSTISRSPCPLCSVGSSRIQGHYFRTVAELPWSSVNVEFILWVRRFYCDNEKCERKIFTERLPGVVRPYGRKTSRLEKALRVIAQAEGGEAGARTAKELGMKVSPDTLLNQIRRNPEAQRTTPRILGVDDFALRKGQRYGTILVDLEEHTPVDLLPERSAESFAAWLKEHPGVEMISRDRAQVYAQGGREGAPNATHVADRFHLLKNLTETVEQVLWRQHGSLQQVAKNIASEQTSSESESESEPVLQQAKPQPTPIVIKSAQSISEMRRQRRLDRYNEVVELYKQGVPIKTIAQHFMMHRRTVRRFIRADRFPERATPKARRSLIEKYLPYLKKRWDEGCHTAAELWREIVALGYKGSQPLVRQTVAGWRKPLPEQFRRTQRRGPASKKKAITLPAPRQVSFWLLGLSKEKDEEKKQQQQSFIDRLCNISAEVKKAQELGKEFIEMVRQRQSEVFDDWLVKAKTSGLKDLKNFAVGLEQDREAVYAALKLEISNGQVEGQVNRLKFLKRQMYGRAKFDLLKAKVLHPT
jgi:transposase